MEEEGGRGLRPRRGGWADGIVIDCCIGCMGNRRDRGRGTG